MPTQERTEDGSQTAEPARSASHHPRLALALGVIAVLLGGFAVWSARQADGLTGTATARNVALTDNARTSEVKGQVTDVINTVFSYNYADVAKTERAAQTLLTGKAVEQYNRLFGQVRNQAPAQKAVLTTTVTESGVKSLEGDRARLLLFLDQRNTRTDQEKTSHSAAMLSVGAVFRNGRWKVDDITTFP